VATFFGFEVPEGRLLATFIVFGDFWRLKTSPSVAFSGAKKSPKQGGAGAPAGARQGGLVGARSAHACMVQTWAQLRGSGQPAMRPFHCQGGCPEEAANGVRCQLAGVARHVMEMPEKK